MQDALRRIKLQCKMFQYFCWEHVQKTKKLHFSGDFRPSGWSWPRLIGSYEDWRHVILRWSFEGCKHIGLDGEVHGGMRGMPFHVLGTSTGRLLHVRSCFGVLVAGVDLMCFPAPWAAGGCETLQIIGLPLLKIQGSLGLQKSGSKQEHVCNLNDRVRSQIWP